ncbi:MAG TPA: formylglycine-generating enzyme family protein [Gammaproteobacteria bacterium]|jgi:formylglycine-generating enzyme required for sulfatase activity|nr:formylglycine-generating enzyme family protein [Gammaproteobacteria bacterium]
MTNPANNSISQNPPEPGRMFYDLLDNGDQAPQMIALAAGQFVMGSSEDEFGSFKDEQPQHPVTIDYAFAIGRYPVTFANYDVFAKATGRDLPMDEGWGRKSRPAINVSYYDAVAYCKWLTEQTGREYKLPSEAEWEYAARADTKTAYWWGDKLGQDHTVCETCGSKWDDETTAPVGRFQPNAWGLHDMLGNTWEWCQDHWHEDFTGAPDDGSVWEAGNNQLPRVLRGGSWLNNPISVRSAVRSDFHPRLRVNIIGFRVSCRL